MAHRCSHRSLGTCVLCCGMEGSPFAYPVTRRRGARGQADGTPQYRSDCCMRSMNWGRPREGPGAWQRPASPLAALGALGDRTRGGLHTFVWYNRTGRVHSSAAANHGGAAPGVPGAGRKEETLLQKEQENCWWYMVKVSGSSAACLGAVHLITALLGEGGGAALRRRRCCRGWRRLPRRAPKLRAAAAAGWGAVGRSRSAGAHEAGLRAGRHRAGQGASRGGSALAREGRSCRAAAQTAKEQP